MYFWTIGPPTFSVSVTTVSFNTVHSVYIHSDGGKQSTYVMSSSCSRVISSRPVFFYLNYR